MPASQPDHRITTEYVSEFLSYWECSCGRAGSAAAADVDLASDKHIPPGDHRIDVRGGA